ncbi:MAG: glycerol-3-phosphate acyltransferase, partial [Bacilli bacterium]|nr:glycerol-3-phosphate acyltransferase [Bacilli bacterium]
CPWLLPILLIIFFLIALKSRYVSLSSLISASLTLIATITLCLIGYDPVLGLEIDLYFPLFSFLMMMIIFFRHKENIDRLRNHSEKKFSFPKKTE